MTPGTGGHGGLEAFWDTSVKDSPNTTMQHNSQPSTHGEGLLSLSRGALGFHVTLALS